MNLQQAIEFERGDVVAFVGAGGKTSALARLAREYTAAGWRVLATTTTRIASDELALFPFACHRAYSGEALALALDDHQCVFYYTEIKHGKVHGVAPEQVRDLMREARADVILVEADGARRLPLKAPYAHEPVMPDGTTVIIQCAGFGALGQPLDDAHVYNARGLAFSAGVPLNALIDAHVMTTALTLFPHAQNTRVRRIGLINQVPPDAKARGQAAEIARLALAEGMERVLIGAVQAEDAIYEAYRRVSAIVLGAGMSARMGRSKPLLAWGDTTVIEQIIRQLQAASVSDIVVISGAQAEAVAEAAGRAGARCVHNPDYATGEMLSSLKCGLRALDRDVSAALVVLGDQPSLRAINVRRVLLAYAEGRGTIIAPSHVMRRGHPILIDRRCWQEILDLPPDSAPRDVINRHGDDIAYVECDDSILRDIDTPEAYQDELRRAGLG